MKFCNDRIRQLREQHGLSQNKFAEKLGVKRESVIQWEQNQCSPRAETIARICAVFGTQASYFFVKNTACVQTNEQQP